MWVRECDIDASKDRPPIPIDVCAFAIEINWHNLNPIDTNSSRALR